MPRVPDLLSNQIRHAVLVSAVVPPDGTRALDQIDTGVRQAVEQSNVGSVYDQTRAGAAARLCNDMDETTAASVQDRVIDDSTALLREPVELSGHGREIPRTHVRTSPGSTATWRNARSGPSRCSGRPSSISTPATWR
ncbi:hypothetical protein [Streptomyces sp. NPDC101776]|uniref:hypothetical protein n=1 Tax=Streptomyces sp. NPDC101776 TaxID=3366146 RepID=UPI0037F5B664